MFLFFLTGLSAQVNNGRIASYSFNKGNAKDDLGKHNAKEVGVSFVADRFGNERSACYLHGTYGSYLNLGTSDSLKPSKGSISLWTNIGVAIEAGTGYKMNPILVTKCENTDDFFEAYCIYFDYGRNKFAAGTTLSPLIQVGLSSDLSPELNTWYHIVITYDDDWFTFYIDGREENKIKKGFHSKFLQGDSIMVGNSANTKNKRFFNGAVDDIVLYNKILSPAEVKNLYNAPNPNKYSSLIKWVIFILIGIGITIVVIAFFVRQFRKEMEKNRLQNKIYELEIKAMKAQMNPHFIFNSLNSIQQFVLEKDDDNAYSYLSKFSILLRKILETNTKESICLDDEIKILKGYLEIETLRFSNSFDWEIISDEKLITSKINIPHMMIQPFVENAIWHGLLHKKGDKKLIVRFEFIDVTKLKCSIEDNGAGRMEKKENILPEKKSLAIDFIKQRLDLIGKMKKTEYSLVIKDKKDNFGNNEGTLVEIILPVLD